MFKTKFFDYLEKSFFAILKGASSVIILTTFFFANKIYSGDVFSTYTKFTLSWNFYSILAGMGANLLVYRKAIKNDIAGVYLIIFNFLLCLPFFLFLENSIIVIFNSFLVSLINYFAFIFYLNKEKRNAFNSIITLKVSVLFSVFVYRNIPLYYKEVCINFLFIIFIFFKKRNFKYAYSEFSQIIKNFRLYVYLAFSDFLNNSAMPYFYYLVSRSLSSSELATFYLLSRFAQPVYSVGQILNSLYLQSKFSNEKIPIFIIYGSWFVAIIWSVLCLLILNDIRLHWVSFIILVIANLIYMSSAEFQADFFQKNKIKNILSVNVISLSTISFIFFILRPSFEGVINLYLSNIIFWLLIANLKEFKYENSL